MPSRYWMLQASLPHLPHPDRATRLPIGAERLESRWHLLAPPDRERLRVACDLLAWAAPSDDLADGAALHRRATAFLGGECDDAVRGLVDAILERRSLVAALRARQAGAMSPAWATWAWGRAAEALKRRRDAVDFGLGRRLPWMPVARVLLADGDAIGLERLLTGLDWAACEAVRRVDPQAFAAMLAYRLQWQMLHRRLARDSAIAATRLHRWADTVLGAAPVAAGGVP